ncbi:hypothetical protein [Mycobacterium sp. RTGN5]|uniref:hypothetical protein n=1 Tax=Mycobacterium sp. RTGN5 TaxID=3016522 RepID=UPI0029C6B733|nr:hypothetical protein [Mycobacterium sp. RTGN5]
MTPDQAGGPHHHAISKDDAQVVADTMRAEVGLPPQDDTTMMRAAEPVRTDLLRREPRCRICREESLRIEVNAMLDWRGVPTFEKGGKSHRVTYAEIFRDLEPLNEGRDKKDLITYSALWNHARLHYNLAGVASYLSAQLDKKLRKGLSRKAV